MARDVQCWNKAWIINGTAQQTIDRCLLAACNGRIAVWWTLHGRVAGGGMATVQRIFNPGVFKAGKSTRGWPRPGCLGCGRPSPGLLGPTRAPSKCPLLSLDAQSATACLREPRLRRAASARPCYLAARTSKSMSLLLLPQVQTRLEDARTRW